MLNESFQIPRRRLRAAWAFVTFTVVFFTISITAGYVLAAKNGRGSGLGDGYTVASCWTPGGPYYVSHVPRELQTCPHGLSSQIKNQDQSVPGNPEGADQAVGEGG